VHCLSTNHQQTALHVTSMSGHTKSYCQIVESLLRMGADVNCRRGTPHLETAAPHYGKTPLYLACQAGHASMAHVLLHAGAHTHCLCTSC